MEPSAVGPDQAAWKITTAVLLSTRARERVMRLDTDFLRMRQTRRLGRTRIVLQLELSEQTKASDGSAEGRGLRA